MHKASFVSKGVKAIPCRYSSTYREVDVLPDPLRSGTVLLATFHNHPQRLIRSSQVLDVMALFAL
jgi:hypothetical protein